MLKWLAGTETCHVNMQGYWNQMATPRYWSAMTEQSEADSQIWTGWFTVLQLVHNFSRQEEEEKQNKTMFLSLVISCNKWLAGVISSKKFHIAPVSTQTSQRKLLWKLAAIKTDLEKSLTCILGSQNDVMCCNGCQWGNNMQNECWQLFHNFMVAGLYQVVAKDFQCFFNFFKYFRTMILNPSPQGPLTCML